MNVIIANKYQTILGGSGIEVIKTSFGVFDVTQIVNMYSNFFYNKMIIDVTALNDYKDIDTIQYLSLNLDMSKVILMLDDSVEVNSPLYLSQLVSMGIYNFTRKIETVRFLIDHPNSYKDVASYQKLDGPSPLIGFNDKVERQETVGEMKQKIVGIVNVTEHAGATTLSYMMKKYLSNYYDVVSVEVNKNDYMFFNDRELVSAMTMNLDSKLIECGDKEVILIDLNDEICNKCTDIIYLIEPGIIKLNKLIKNKPTIFNELKNEKIILNKSVLNDKDVRDFEKESGSKIFSNVCYIDDKLDNDVNIKKLLIDLGFTRVSDEVSSFHIF